MRWKNPSRTWDALEEESEAIKELSKYGDFFDCPEELQERLKRDSKFMFGFAMSYYQDMFGLNDGKIHPELYPKRFFEKFTLNDTINLMIMAVNRKCRVEDLDYYKELDNELKGHRK